MSIAELMHVSEGPQRFDVLTGAERRRCFPAGEKTAIVEESYADGTSVCGVARRHGLTLYADDGRVEMDSNKVDRLIRPLALTRKNALFAGSDRGRHT